MVEIFTKSTCPFCARAKWLLDGKGAKYAEHELAADPGHRERMERRSGGARTVPQIFIGDFHVGGCDDLHRMEASGELDRLLAG